MAAITDSNVDQSIEKRQSKISSREIRRRKVLNNADSRLKFILGCEQSFNQADVSSSGSSQSRSLDVNSVGPKQQQSHPNQTELHASAKSNYTVNDNVSNHDAITKESPETIHDQWLEMKRKSLASHTFPWTTFIHCCLVSGTASIAALIKLHYFNNFLNSYFNLVRLFSVFTIILFWIITIIIKSVYLTKMKDVRL